MIKVRTVHYDGVPIRVVEKNGDLWFVGADIAMACGFTEYPHEAVEDYVDAKNKMIAMDYDERCDCNCKTELIDYIGVYELYKGLNEEEKAIGPNGRKFHDWFYSELVPCLLEDVIFLEDYTS